MEYSRVLPCPVLRWGTPVQTWDGVCPLSRPRMGYPPPCPDLGWDTPISGLGWSSPQSRPEMGYTPPPKCEQTGNITFPHPSDAGGNDILVEKRISTLPQNIWPVKHCHIVQFFYHSATSRYAHMKCMQKVSYNFKDFWYIFLILANLMKVIINCLLSTTVLSSVCCFPDYSF